MLGACCGVQSGAAPEKVSSLSLNATESPGKSRGTDHRRMTREEVEEKGLNIGIGLAGGPPKPSEEEAQKKSSKEPKEPRRGSKDSKDSGGEGGKSGEDELMPFRKKTRKPTKKKTAGTGTEAFGARGRRKSVDCMEKYLSSTSNGGENSSPSGGYPGSSSVVSKTALQPVTKDTVESNMFVVRGIDWKYNDEDGGNGQVGTVFDFDTKKETITVFWHSTQHVGQQYRMGKKCDLAIAPEQASRKARADAMIAAGAGGRRNSQFMFSMSFQTVIIFDWDDTLFPTTYVRDDMELAWQKPMKEQPLDAREKADITKKLEKCAEHAIKLLRIANDLGKVILVTLARNPWVTTSCNNFFEKVGKLIEQLNIPIIYAQTGVQVDYDKMAMASNDEIEQYWSGIKGKAIANEVKQFYSKYEGQSWKNIISIGDSDFERLGTQAATADYVKQAGLGSEDLRSWSSGGGDSASEVDGHVFKVRTKTFKLVDQPTIEELTVEVELLQKLLPLMVNLDNGFDVNLSNLEDEDELKRIEKTLQGV